MKDSLNRRLPAVERMMDRAGIGHDGYDVSGNPVDLLDVVLGNTNHVLKVAPLLNQAIGVYEHDIVPEEVRRREEEEERRRWVEANRPLPRAVPPDPIPPLEALIAAVPTPPRLDLAVAESTDMHSDAGAEPGDAAHPPPAPVAAPKPTLRDRIENNLTWTLILVAAAALTAGFTAGYNFRETLEAALARRGAGAPAPAPVASPTTASARQAPPAPAAGANNH